MAARTDLSENATIDDYKDNYLGVENLIKCANDVSTIQMCAIYSSMLVCRSGYTQRDPYDFSPSTIYGESKVRAERAILSSNPKFPWVILRPTTIWGPWHLRLRREFYRIIKSGLYFHPQYKDCRRSYGYVKNAVDQTLNIIFSDPELVRSRPFYLADTPIVVRDYVNCFSNQINGKTPMTLPYPLSKTIAVFGDLLKIFGLKFPVTSFRLNNMTSDNVINNESTVQICGKQQYSMEDGVVETVNWFKNFEID